MISLILLRSFLWLSAQKLCFEQITPDVRIVRLGEKRDETWTLFRRLEQDEAERHDGSSSNVVINVGDSDVQ